MTYNSTPLISRIYPKLASPKDVLQPHIPHCIEVIRRLFSVFYSSFSRILDLPNNGTTTQVEYTLTRASRVVVSSE